MKRRRGVHGLNACAKRIHEVMAGDMERHRRTGESVRCVLCGLELLPLSAPPASLAPLPVLAGSGCPEPVVDQENA